MRLWITAAAALLSACVSTEMRGFVGKDISEVMMAYGQPEAVLELPDGRRAYQYRRGERDVFASGTGRATVNSTPGGATATVTPAPVAVIHDEGCLLTFIALPSGNSWVVTDIRVPRDLVC